MRGRSRSGRGSPMRSGQPPEDPIQVGILHPPGSERAATKLGPVELSSAAEPQTSGPSFAERDASG